MILDVARGTRPDIAHTTTSLCRKVSAWGIADDQNLKHLMGYLKTTRVATLTMPSPQSPHYDHGESVDTVGWADSDLAGDRSGGSTSGWVVGARIGNVVAPINWGSKLQNAVSTSTTEAAAVALEKCASL
eukprot:GHVN01087576.1.p1 GENE.GHVN01087576.1~~GHVN01087576.1.p1  ORF type:complete len:130 (-),score=4.12 GHVN01087576.1:764-1153(-)